MFQCSGNVPADVPGKTLEITGLFWQVEHWNIYFLLNSKIENLERIEDI
jgi:hypothetical protein